MKLDSSAGLSSEAYGIEAKWVNSFNLNDINAVLKELVK